jgi:NADH-quinone oxidoreductase subunit E|uniref:NADH-quinone oxidoreductase subunit NuoE n=1 Tax=Desulfobacca acetoxidans TaxID=60893 RepID=A0A7C3V0D0_9BACT
MLPDEVRQSLEKQIAAAEHPREQVINVMYLLQKHYGYLSDEAVQVAAELLGLTTLEIEELATFYDFIYREPVGKFVIHVCDGVVCWMFHEGSVFDYLCQKLGVCAGEITKDGLFTVLPTACLGYCDHAPAMLINGVFYGSLTPERIDEILEKLRTEYCELVICR